MEEIRIPGRGGAAIFGPRYIQIDTPCPSVCGFPSDRTLEVGRLGVKTGIIPLFEMEDGKITSVRKIKNRVSGGKYLEAQKRFRHLDHDDGTQAELGEIQLLADSNIEKYGLA